VDLVLGIGADLTDGVGQNGGSAGDPDQQA